MEEVALRIQSNLSQVFSQLSDNSSIGQPKSEVEENVTTEDCLPPSLSRLPTFPILKQISDTKVETLKRQSEIDLKPFIKLFEKVENTVYDGMDLAANIATCLEFIHNSSQLLQQVLKDPMSQDALPLPHHMHRKTIDMIEACVWTVQHPRWQPLSYEVEWGNLLPKLRQEVSDWIVSAKLSGKHLKEVEDLKQKLDMVLENYSSTKNKD
ncbi:uncharacterized protein LOC113216655 [Frankliniella occidentalis]|uniref:Uncharacterized protein LOC113216655 n=1 Tax=Frankliniella occidentalis TaxID=133901 RepID=A0A6J1TN20_FRAOC|nr:uncharacterized protein LOC113216655 [Frankliniella occidentalis]